ncbi:MAG: hypothetical protein MUD14_21490 [Hydrococcus sp. Prado102]|jgi:hypothetical protein|nr:hypothetical protein [Hydrococcus sp. Prado102]
MGGYVVFRGSIQSTGTTNLGKIGNVIIEEKLISLTLEQAVKSVELCQSLSDLHQDIVLFRFDDFKGEIYILAGLDIEIIIYSTGIWEFLPNET